jgi:MinD-like ATPase involved in chromosome partitioning or flagellar assembly
MIITFYSFKGGVGRTQALANIAVVLAQAGHSVLAVDFDLEAPGLSRYYENAFRLDLSQSAGLLDLLVRIRDGDESDWREHISSLPIQASGRLDLMTSGRVGPGYAASLLDFDWKHFFQKADGGEAIERLRSEWSAAYEFVLVDSRTGITDSGGICTIQLPDVLIPVFAANEQSLSGAIDVVHRAQLARMRLARAPGPALVFPLPSRFDDRTEIDLADAWMSTFAKDLAEFYEPWVPEEYTAREVLERTKLPYVPYYSFGESLPVLRDSSGDLSSLGFALRSAAAIISREFEDISQFLTNSHRAGPREATIGDYSGWDPRRSPYPGLQSFTPEDAAVYFGREREAARLVQLLSPTLQDRGGRFVAVVGPSGSGKSSLLYAGLVPRLAREPHRWLVVPPLQPGSRPIARLAASLAVAFSARSAARRTDDVIRVLEHGSAGLIQLVRELAEVTGEGTGPPRVLVVIDQAEELLTRTGPGEQQAFLRTLTESLHADSPLWVVAALRSEFLSTTPDRAGFAEAIDDTMIIEPLSRSRMAEVIVRPAQRVGLEFAPGLVERMVEDTAGGDALPLLSYTLRELYERAHGAKRITAADYDALGGVVGALRGRADLLADELRRLGLGSLVMPTLLQLVTVASGEQPMRRRAQRNKFTRDEQVVVDAFVDASLLVTDLDPADPGGGAVVEVAHEALLRQWPPLREAIESTFDLLRLRAEVERLSADWQLGGRDESYLVRGGRLAVVADWASRQPGELRPPEREFVEASRSLAQRELEVARRNNRRLRILAATVFILVIALILTAVLAVSR